MMWCRGQDANPDGARLESYCLPTAFGNIGPKGLTTGELAATLPAANIAK
jgi:hypothetical protein